MEPTQGADTGATGATAGVPKKCHRRQTLVAGDFDHFRGVATDLPYRDLFAGLEDSPPVFYARLIKNLPGSFSDRFSSVHFRRSIHEAGGAYFQIE